MLSQNESIQEQLRAREVDRITGKNSETITYDTGQTITRTKATEKTSNLVKELTGIETQDVVQTEAVDMRGGHVRTRNGGGHGMRQAQGYPELAEFADRLKQFRHSYLQPHPPAILAVLPTLAGHGNMHPLAIFHPVVAWNIFKHTVFPFEKMEAISLRKAREHFRKSGDLVEAAAITPDYDGWVACVCGDRYPEREGKDATLKIKIFNPKLFAEAAKEDWVQCVPTRHNSLFEVMVSVEWSMVRHWPTADLHSYPYARKALNAVEDFDLASVERERGAGFYIKVDDALLSKLEKLAPLPVEASDCGAALGFPQLNEEAQARQMAVWEKQKELSELATDAKALIGRMKSKDAWISTADSAKMEEFDTACLAGERFLARLKYEKSYSPDTSKDLPESIMFLKLAPEEVELAKKILVLSNRERKYLGIKGGTKVFYQLCEELTQ